MIQSEMNNKNKNKINKLGHERLSRNIVLNIAILDILGN